MTITMVNNLSGTLSMCCGTKEYEVKSGENIEIEVQEQDVMYLDQLD